MLSSIDEILSEKGKPLHLRPLDAATLLARHSIVRIEGDDDKDNYLDKPWFAALYAEVYAWYKSKYGSLMNVKQDAIVVLAVHRGIARTIQIPRTIAETQNDGVVKITFPSAVYESEDISNWIRPKIPKRAMGSRNLKLLQRMKITCGALRKISLNAGSAGGKNTGVPLMAASITDHLSNAAGAVSSEREEKNSLALWDLHLACEKSIKSLLTQQNIPFPKIHDLARLNALLCDNKLKIEASRIIRRLPDDKTVIGHRYLQETRLTPNQLYIFYTLAVRLCLLYTSDITHKFKIADASFFLRRAPWLSQIE